MQTIYYTFNNLIPLEEAPNDGASSKEPGKTGEDTEDDYENVEKYLLFQKLRTLKYRLDNYNTDIEDEKLKRLKEVSYMIDVLINFFNAFEYKKINEMIEAIADELEKDMDIKAYPEKNDKKEKDEKNSDKEKNNGDMNNVKQ